MMGRQAVLGRWHPETLEAVATLALLASRLGRLDDAEALHCQALTGRREARRCPAPAQGPGRAPAQDCGPHCCCGVILRTARTHAPAHTPVRMRLRQRACVPASP